MKKINTLFALLYVVGLIASAYALYQLPMNLVKSQAIDLTQLNRVQPVIDQLYLIIGISLALGVAALLGSWLVRKDPEILNPKATHTDQDDTDWGYEEQGQTDTKNNLLQIEGLDKIVASVENEEEAFTKALSLVCHHLEASQAAAYRAKHTEEYSYIELFASFAYHAPEGETITYRFGEGLAGQVAKQGECVVMDTVPEGYLEILSGLGKASPTHLMILPIKLEAQVVGVVEIASFQEFSVEQKSGLPAIFDRLALKLLNSDNVSLEEATS